ncbi:glycosyltransferase family 4 protein [Sphingomonas montana]|uniref:glycosyltransferase family 4 protein n=1 Tax=Sphingomonas montana TaxID=1843236 RepID=UPI00096DFB3F|nr:glycosyltransferase family 1 protein [Sphingomonas montana]
MQPPVILDISRLISRVLHPTPTGVDRVEMAYARGLHAALGERLRFAAVHPAGHYGRLNASAVLRFLDQTEDRWENHGIRFMRSSRQFAFRAMAALHAFERPPADTGERRIYVQSSPHHLTRPDFVGRILKRENARFICLVHDLIPLEFPEYARSDGAGLHRVRIETIIRHAAGIIANSHATLASLQPWITASGRTPLVSVAHLGTHDAASACSTAVPSSDRPYFVSIGTIEPRKNHLLLLNIWRRLSNLHGSNAVPKLVLIGRRGWENEQVVDMLERCPSLRGCVDERAGLSDAETRQILAGARALLMPSFAEGYGMPVTEALDLNVPVLCSDLSALREAGGDVPYFIDPLDGPAWARAIIDLAAPDSTLRVRHDQNIGSWERPHWSDHIRKVTNLIDQVATRD